MSTIGLVGAGHIGSTLARLAVAAGHDVVLSNSRGPETLRDLVEELGPQACAATPQEAAKAADLAVVTVPLMALRDLPATELAGKVVMDTINYYPERDGHVAALDDESTTTSELVQEHLADSRVVKVFNNITSGALGALARPAGSARPLGARRRGGRRGRQDRRHRLPRLHRLRRARPRAARRGLAHPARHRRLRAAVRRRRRLVPPRARGCRAPARAGRRRPRYRDM